MSKSSKKHSGSAPERDPAPVYEALRAFAPDQKIEEKGTLNSRIDEIAAEFNKLCQKQIRFRHVAEELERLESAANAYAAALRTLNEYSVIALVGGRHLGTDESGEPKYIDDNTWRVYSSEEKNSPPEDDAAVAFSTGIRAPANVRGEDYLRRHHVFPTIAAATAMGRVAKSVTKQIRKDYPDRGGKSPNISERVDGLPKYNLVKECFWLIHSLYGDAGTDKCKATPDSSKSPFVAFLYAMFRYATGKFADGKGASNFETPLKKCLPELREDLRIGFEVKLTPDEKGRYIIPCLALSTALQTAVSPLVLCSDRKAMEDARRHLPGHMVIIAPNALAFPEKTHWEELSGREILIWAPDRRERAANAKPCILAGGAKSVEIIPPL